MDQDIYSHQILKPYHADIPDSSHKANMDINCAIYFDFRIGYSLIRDVRAERS